MRAHKTQNPPQTEAELLIMEVVEMHPTLTKQEKYDMIHKFSPHITFEKDGCVVYNGPRITRFRGKTISALRLFIMLSNKVVPASVDHKFRYSWICSNTRCLEKSHLAFDKYPTKKDEILPYLHKYAQQKGDCMLFTKVMPSPNEIYTRIQWRGKRQQLHRMVYYSESEYDNIEDLPKHLCIAHMCKELNCVNPKHFVMTTMKVNNKEHKQRDGTLLIGEKNHRASIDTETAKRIANSWADKPRLTRKERARKFGCTELVVQKIDAREAWHHIPHPNGNQPKTRRSTGAYKPYYTREERNRIKAGLRRSSDSIHGNILDSACWLWRTKTKGRPRMMFLNFGRIAARYAAIVVVGKDEPHLHALHLCGDRQCVNPDHIRFGTDKQNAIDRFEHGRDCSKLLKQDVFNIRTTEKGTSVRILSKKYNVSVSTIYAVRNYKSWKNLQVSKHILFSF